MKKLRVFRNDQAGASMVEYGIALLVVTAVGVTLMSAIGTKTGETVTDACEKIGGDCS
jgi:Flp pilus assembly pilin Flp